MALMALTSVAALLEVLRQTQLLEPGQLEEISLPAQLRLAEPPEPFAQLLVERGWLTPYQKERLLEGRGAELVLGRYVLLDRLGVGGMGHVFRARHRRLSRIDAVKIILREYLDDPEAVLRFQREAQAVARLSHPNIVRIYDAAEADGVHYLAMEYVEGTDLERLVEQNGPLPAAQACDYIRQAALGLEHAHERGLVHRDVKPGNFLVDRDGVVRVLDLGLARLEQPTEDDDDEKGTDVLTRVGSTMGTLDYQAPEQANDPHSVDGRADIYSLGCTFYYLLAGRAPFADASPMEKLLRHQSSEPVPIEQLRTDLPHGLGDVLRKMMAKAPADRYPSAAGVADALLPYLQDEIPTGNVFEDMPDTQDPKSVHEDTEDAEQTRAEEKPEWQHLLPPLRRHSRAVLTGLVLGAVIVAGGALYLVSIPPGPSAKGSGDDSTTAGPPVPGDGLAQTKDKAEPAQPLPERFTIKSLDMEFVLIKAGKFLMGSPKDESGRNSDETAHPVTLTRDYYLSVHKVTQQQFSQVMSSNPSLFKAGPGQPPGLANGADTNRFPVEQVTWTDARTFCDMLKGYQEPPGPKYVYRLPTEAEWEYACRAGTHEAYFFGNTADALGDYAWYAANSDGVPHPVGSRKPNPWGLHGMYGNLWEWCADWYNEFFFVFPLRDDPWNGTPPEKNARRVIRGGCYTSLAPECRSATRGASEPIPSKRAECIGFRVACGIGLFESKKD
jgi:serine/threonine protein kinase